MKSILYKNIFFSIEDHSRVRRQLNSFDRSSDENRVYTIEVLLAVDRKMQEFHVKNNLEVYVLTLMSIASNIFADASIGNFIKLAVVDIVYLKEDLNVKSFHSGKI